jgi:hypothetical protein
MAIFTTIANITKVALDGKFYVKGVGKYSYEKDKDNHWTILEGDTTEKTCLVDEKTLFELSDNDDVQRAILASAVVNKKSIKINVVEKFDTEQADDEKALSGGRSVFIVDSIEIP